MKKRYFLPLAFICAGLSAASLSAAPEVGSLAGFSDELAKQVAATIENALN